MAADIVLLAGMWLRGSVWAQVATELTRAGHRPVVPVLPGVDVDAPDADLDDQLAAVLATVDSVGRSIVVGHSAAASLAWLVADRRPEQVERVVLIGGFPETDGAPYFDAFPVVGGVVPFPGWESFDGADIRDLDEMTRSAVAVRTVPVRSGIAEGVVHLRDPRRFAVPVTVVCPEFSPDDARGWIAEGQLPELADAADVSYVDIDTGHWPMITQPSELTRLLCAIAAQG